MVSWILAMVYSVLSCAVGVLIGYCGALAQRSKEKAYCYENKAHNKARNRDHNEF